MMNWLKRLIGAPWLLVWLGMFVFAYAWLTSLLLQLWVIPTLFSQPGAAEGLVILDSIGFDRIAKAKVVEIVSLGWSAWELKPQSQSPAGIASFFYAVFGTSPSSVLPFNAVVRALVFALNPASFEWVAQIHRDGIFILGNLLFIYGIMSLFRPSSDGGGQGLRYLSSMMFMSTLGITLVWVRPGASEVCRSSRNKR